MRAEDIVNPPLMIMGNETVLCPPINGVDEYMEYLREHREDYARLFGIGDKQ